MDDTKCYILGLRKYQNSEIECVNKIMTQGYKDLAILPDVPIFIDFKSNGLAAELDVKSQDQLTVVGYCTLTDKVTCEFGGDETILDIDNHRYNENLIPGWFGNVHTGYRVGRDRVLYATIALDYRTINQRVMPAVLSSALGRFISYNILSDVFGLLIGYGTNETKSKNPADIDGYDATFMTKVKFCVSMLETYISSIIMRKCSLKKYVDMTLKYNIARSSLAINTINGIYKFDAEDFKTPFDVVANAMYYMIDSSVINGSDKVDMICFFETVDDLRRRAMDDRTGVRDKKNKTIAELKKLGKLDEYLDAYEKYFDKHRTIAIERIRTLEEQTNSFFSHVFTKKQITEEEVNSFYAAVLNCVDLVSGKHKQEELNSLFRKISTLEVMAKVPNIDDFTSVIKTTSAINTNSVYRTVGMNIIKKKE